MCCAVWQGCCGARYLAYDEDSYGYVDGFSRVDVVAGKVLHALDAGLTIQGSALRVTASIGIGLFPIHAIGAQALLRCADYAMFLAKQAGGNRFRLARMRGD